MKGFQKKSVTDIQTDLLNYLPTYGQSDSWRSSDP